MRTLVILGCLIAGLMLFAGCGGETKGTDQPVAPAEAGAPSSQGGAGAGGGAPIGAGGAVSGRANGGATAGMGDAGAVTAGGAVSAGGVTAGGSAAGGAPTETIPVPEGCVSVDQSQETGMCNLGMRCDGQYSSVVCSEGAGDDWRCNCIGLFSAEVYDVQAATSGLACAVAGAFCSVKGPEIEAAEECLFEESKGPGYCDSARTCTRSVEVAGSITVHVSQRRWVRCEADEAGIVECACPGDPSHFASSDFLFAAVDLEADGCAFAQEFCKTRRWSPAGARSCETQSSSTAPELCELSLGCEQPIELEDGTVVSRHWSDYLSCFTVSGRSHCVCNRESYSLAFELTADSTTLAVCSQAAELCERQDELLRGDSIECLVLDQSAEGGTCSVSLECTQGATIGDVPIGVLGLAESVCEQNGDSWECTCLAGTNQESLTLEAEDARGACMAASEVCPEVVGLGPYDR
jgi:hypothetical protein